MTESNKPLLQMKTRRNFLQRSGVGIGSVALASLLMRDGIAAVADQNPMAARSPHFRRQRRT